MRTIRDLSKVDSPCELLSAKQELPPSSVGVGRGGGSPGRLGPGSLRGGACPGAAWCRGSFSPSCLCLLAQGLQARGEVGVGWGSCGRPPPGQPSLCGAAAQVDPGGSLFCSPEARLQVERALGPHLRWDPRLLAVSHGAGAGVLPLRRHEPQETPAQTLHWADV